MIHKWQLSAMTRDYVDPEQEDYEEALQHRAAGPCDCLPEHREGAACACLCHARRPDGRLVDNLTRPYKTRFVCGECYVQDHDRCDGLRANGAPCECGVCAEDAHAGF